jgi:hypothetical protein
MRKLFLMSLMFCLCPLLLAEEAPVPSADDTDKMISESIVPEKPVEKKKTQRYKNKKLKKVKKGKKLKRAKVKNKKKLKTKVRGKHGKKKPSL